MPRRLTRSGLRGYPAPYRKSLRRWWIGCAWALALLGAPVFALAYLSLHGNVPVRVAAVFAAIFLYALLVTIIGTLSEPALVLYFEREVPGDWYTGSEAMARNCVTLDGIAAGAGVSAVSTFGFADDFLGEPITWHAPEQGLLTVSRLREKLGENPGLVREAKTILADLDKMRDRLQEARRRQTRFCLILHENVMSGIEVERRKGYF